jgi:propionyl-CoA synthetase
MPVKAGSATKAVCGYDIRIFNENGTEQKANEEGLVVVKLPLPPGNMLGIWENEARFKASYFSKFDGYYLSGDGGYKDEEGYIFITGRTDDVINVAGHRLSTAEMEEVVAAHICIAECAVIGIHDELKGQVPLALVVTKLGTEMEQYQLEQEIIKLVRHQIGAVASLRNVVLVPRLPKTRSGKILRKLMRSIADGAEFQIPSTIDDEAIIEEITSALQKNKIGIYNL